ncbi:secretion protein EccK [Mycolicibacterium farcinogenes]|nr:secretion protein EccK [Mycolicibacterium farcinogenes]
MGLTVEGTIIVANTYGMAYIPKGVNLPEPVKMVSADESIPASERAKWVAYPYLALQGWAQHHEQRLRVVFGTEEQLQGIDPGAQKMYLSTADIPEDGSMQGRSRLRIIAPDVAERLASVSTAGLTEILPPRPADDTPPDDNADQLWFEMIKPLMRSGIGTDIAHLEGFVTYAAHEQELALHRAHTADEGDAQREAIEDWIYWQHVGVLTGDALVGSAPAQPS